MGVKKSFEKIFKVNSLDEIEAHNRKGAISRRREYVAENGNVRKVDLTYEKRNEKLYKNQTHFDEQDSSKGNIGSTAFYNRK